MTHEDAAQLITLLKQLVKVLERINDNLFQGFVVMTFIWIARWARGK